MGMPTRAEMVARLTAVRDGLPPQLREACELDLHAMSDAELADRLDKVLQADAWLAVCQKMESDGYKVFVVAGGSADPDLREWARFLDQLAAHISPRLRLTAELLPEADTPAVLTSR